MKWKNLLIAFIVVIALLLLSRLIPYSKKVYYDPPKYLKTIEDKIDGNVTRIVEGKNFFGVVLDSNERIIYPISYIIEKMPGNWKSTYPKDFIQVGDKVYKNAMSDTFYLIREDQRWQYFLPK